MPSEQRESDAVRSTFARRSQGFDRLAAWEDRHFHALTPAAALSAAGWLYDLLPPASQRRPVEPTGVQLLHRALARLNVAL